jgi:hypothetical protein
MRLQIGKGVIKPLFGHYARPSALSTTLCHARLYKGIDSSISVHHSKLTPPSSLQNLGQTKS